MHQCYKRGVGKQPQVEQIIQITSAQFSYWSDPNTFKEAQNSFYVISKYSSASWRHLCTNKGILQTIGYVFCSSFLI